MNNKRIMRHKIIVRSVLSDRKCGLTLMFRPSIVSLKNVPFSLLFSWMVALFAVVLLSSCASMQSESCRGFPFDKDFPGTDHRPLDVYYDLSYKWATGHDGLRFRFYYRHPREEQTLPSNVYNDLHLTLSTYEKEYIATREAKDREFDEKYAGAIKKKLLAVVEKKLIPLIQEIRQRKPNSTYPYYIEYPYYLTEDKLPAGLETPATFFSPGFFYDYIEAEKHPGYLRDYFISVRSYKNGTFYDSVTGMSRVGHQVSQRFKANFAEYILTYYYYKKYTNSQQRKLVAEDLATYYSDVAFRASAEHLYQYMHILSNYERCKYANYAAQRIYDYIITAFMDPVAFKKIKDEYRDELLDACWTNQIKIRSFKLPHLRTEEEKEEFKILEKEVLSGAVRCIND